MTKDKFLHNLEKKLSMLSEEERQDTINEYRDIIEEKIKHGKTESEAVKEFGSIDELATEILNAYKINPNYKKSEAGDKAKEIVDGAEELIKKGAKKISEVTDDVVDSIKKSDFEWTTSNVLEIVIKIVLLLLFLALLRIPIRIISEIIFGIGLNPLSHIFEPIWKVIIEIVYLGICIFLIVKLITDYSSKQKKEEEIDKKTKSSSTTKATKTSTKKNDVLETIVFAFLQLFVIFFFLIPLAFFALLFLIAIIVCIYLFSLKIGVYGFFITSVGCFGFIGCLISLVYRGFISSKPIHLYPFIIFILLIVIGGVMSFTYIFSFEYHDTLPPEKYQTKTDIYVEDVNQKTIVHSDNTNIEIDPKLEDHKMRVEITYYPKFSEIIKQEDKDEEQRYLEFNTVDRDHTFSLHGKYSKLIIEDIRKKSLYNYSLLSEENVKIYVNDHTKDLVEIED